MSATAADYVLALAALAALATLATLAALAALATLAALGGATQIGSFLFQSPGQGK